MNSKRCKQNHVKVLRNRFHLNGHTLGFQAQSQDFGKMILFSVVNSAIIRVKIIPRSFYMHGYTQRFHLNLKR